jgi:hypothetical protein
LLYKGFVYGKTKRFKYYHCKVINLSVFKWGIMKHQTTITVDEEIMLKVKSKLRDGSFRNQSHIFEYAVRKLLEEKND